MKEKGIKADYVFFFSYVLVTTESGALDWGDQGLVDQNSKLALDTCIMLLSLLSVLRFTVHCAATIDQVARK